MSNRPGSTERPQSSQGQDLGMQAEQDQASNPDPLRAVCVFCGSAAGRQPQYRTAARALGAMLAQQRRTLVYGGGHVGLMGATADAVLAAGGQVVGVIPEHLMRPEVAHQGLTELHVVDTMHTRKRLMAERSDAFIVLPGGYGTLEELFEVVTWLQLGLHAKPVGLLNVGGYYNLLLQFLDHVANDGFITAANRNLLVVAETPALLLDGLAERVATRRTRGQEPSHLERS